MKNLVLFSFLFFSQLLVAQQLNYQSIVRNTSGTPQINTTVYLRFSILTSETGGVLYRETQTPITDKYGWISSTVGRGVPVSGTFSTIDWSSPRFLLVECGESTGGTYNQIGISPISNSSIGLPGAKGDTGASGAKGDKGDVGAIGPKGDNGAKGETGLKGDKGDTGLMGLPGAKGDKGDIGLTGSQGLIGVAGSKGDKGDKGDTGLMGLPGAKGDKGDIGLTGLTGATGSQGLAGATGAKGDKGDTGLMGLPGAKGDKGDTGSVGTKGDTGFMGLPGAKGDKGDIGLTGLTGATGSQGLAGATGAKGDKGDTGLMGLSGAKGDKGDTGLTGATGSQGLVGAIGAKGDKGDTGLMGLSGAKGDKGDTGLTGATGSQGLAGATGAKGDKGDPGLMGLPGAKGDKGDTGATGGKGDKGDPGSSSEVLAFKATRSTAINDLLNITPYPLIFPMVEYNVGGGVYNQTTGGYIIPSDGYYNIYSSFDIKYISQGNTPILIFRVYKNGELLSRSDVQRTAVTDSYLDNLDFTSLQKLLANDILTFEITPVYGEEINKPSLSNPTLSIFKIGGGGTASGGGTDNQQLSISGNNLSISNGNTITLPSGSGPTYSPGSGVRITENVISAVDSSVTNEIQSLTLSGNELSISGGNTITLPASGSGSLTLPYSNTINNTGIAFEVNNSGTAIRGVGGSSNAIEGFSLGGVGVYGASTNNLGVLGYSINNIGIRGTSRANYGVQGLSDSSAALYGFSGVGVGLYAEVNGGTGAAAKIVNNNGTGHAIDANNVSATNATAKLVNANASGLALETKGGLKLTGIGEAAGKVLTSNAAGLATWQTPASGGGGSGLSGIGEAGIIPRWVNATTLGSSSLSQDIEGNIGLGAIPQIAYKMRIRPIAGGSFKALQLLGSNAPGTGLNLSLTDAPQYAEINLQSAVTNFRTTSNKLAFNARSEAALPLMADHIAIKSNGQVTMGLFDPFVSTDKLSINGNLGLKDASINFYDDANVVSADISVLNPGGKLHFHSSKDGAGLEIMSTGGKIEMSTNGIGGSTSEVVIENGKLTVGNALPAPVKLEVLGQVKIAGGNPGVGKVLTSAADGTASWTAPSSGGSSLWNNSIWASTLSYNAPIIKQVLISPHPESVAVLDNTVLTVAAQNEASVASFISQNTANNSKMVKIHNQGRATEYTNNTALDIINRPFLDSGNGIKIDAGGTGIDVKGDLGAIRAKSLDIAIAGIFEGGGAITATGRHTGVFASADLASNTSTGVRATYSGKGSFNGIGIEATSLPTNAQIREYQGFGIGGKFVGGNKGISVESASNPSSTFLLDLQIYPKNYGAESRPMAGLFKSHSSVGLMAVSQDTHQSTSLGAVGIGVVGRSTTSGGGGTTIGVYGEGEGSGLRIGVMGNADASSTPGSIGVRGTASGASGIGGDFKASEGIHVEGSVIGIHSLAPTNEFIGSSTTKPILKLQHSSVNGGIALELANGYIKVDQSAQAKTAYIHKSISTNTSGNQTRLNYSNMQSTDILMVTHRYNGTYITSPLGVWWNGTGWTIYTENTSTMPLNEDFNIIIIKQ